MAQLKIARGAQHVDDTGARSGLRPSIADRAEHLAEPVGSPEPTERRGVARPPTAPNVQAPPADDAIKKRTPTAPALPRPAPADWALRAAARSPRGELAARARAGAGHPRAATPRAAAYALAAINARRTAPRPDRSGWLALSTAVAGATAADCLDAAFGAPERPFSARGAATEAARLPTLDSDYFRRIAAWLGLRLSLDLACFKPRHDAIGLPASAIAGLRALPVSAPDGPCWLIAPEAAWLPRLAALTCAYPDLRSRFVLTTPAALAAAFPGLLPRVDRGRLQPLHTVHARFVAKPLMTGGQAITLATLVLAVAIAGLLAPAATAWLAAAGLSIALLGLAATRFAAAAHRPADDRHLAGAFADDQSLPVTSILIPLLHEAAVVPQLVKALVALDYPADKLDIQFLVEESDGETLAALCDVHRTLPSATVTIVPDGRPRTKPRALNVGLKRARGSLVAVFDAEDRPEPDQLRKAAAAFAHAPPAVAAVQARLVVDHADERWITRMFAIEYAAQFDGIVPMMSDHGWFFLLGGTSNHFRRDALVAVGGWDPFNVTEDADLAVRLRRAGYLIRAIDSATFEEAPVTVAAWRKQRTRWFKGWMQTWLVHNRDPVRLVREMGVRDAVLFHTLVVGAFLAVAAHPVFLAILALYAAGALPTTVAATLHDALAVLASALVFVAGYGATFWLGARAIARRGLKVPRLAVLTLPAYWALMALALLSAAVELFVRPHYWAKTRHGVARRRPAAAQPAMGQQCERNGRYPSVPESQPASC